MALHTHRLKVIAFSAFLCTGVAAYGLLQSSCHACSAVGVVAMVEVTVFSADGELVRSPNLIVETKRVDSNTWRKCRQAVFYDPTYPPRDDAPTPNPIFCEFSDSGDYVIRATRDDLHDQAPIHWGETPGKCPHIDGDITAINLTLSASSP